MGLRKIYSMTPTTRHSRTFSLIEVNSLVESFCLLEALANTAFFFGIPKEIALKSFWL